MNAEVYSMKQKIKPLVVRKKKRSQGTWPEHENAAFADMRARGMTPAEISAALNKPKKCVWGKIVREDALAKPKPVSSQAYERKNRDPAPMTFDVDPDSPWGRVRSTLRGRVRRTEDGFRLDGRPVGFYDCVKEANRVLKAAGMAQITNIPACIV